MSKRTGVLFILLLILSILHLSAPHIAAAQNTTLYGITSDGKLVQIDVATVTATQVRTTLPAATGVYSGLTLYNGSFQTLSNAWSTGCHIVSFGPTTGDQIDRGGLHNGCDYSLATSPGGDLETVQTVDYMAHRAFALHTISLNILRADPLYNPVIISYGNQITGDWGTFNGFTYKDANTVYEIHPYQVANPPYWPTQYLRLHKLVKTNGLWGKAIDYLIYNINNDVMGLVIDPSSSTTLYTVGGFNHAATPYTSALWKINITGTPTVTNLGSLPGYVITGLVYGPPLNQIVSPNSLPNPPPVRPRRMGEKVWEIIRQIIFN